jgi:hypothetical protein
MSRVRPGHRERPAYEGRLIFGEPGRQQLHHGRRDHELQVLGPRETGITRIGFRETCRWLRGLGSTPGSNDREPGFNRTPVPCDISSTNLVAPTRWEPRTGNGRSPAR